MLETEMEKEIRDSFMEVYAVLEKEGFSVGEMTSFVVTFLATLKHLSPLYYDTVMDIIRNEVVQWVEIKDFRSDDGR